MELAFVRRPCIQMVPPVESGSVAIWNHQVARRLSEFCDAVIYARGADTQTHAGRRQGVRSVDEPLPRIEEVDLWHW